MIPLIPHWYSSKNQKRVLRIKSTEHLYVQRGILYYSKIPKALAGNKRQHWRQVSWTVEEQKQACRSEKEDRNYHVNAMIMHVSTVNGRTYVPNTSI